MTQCAKGEGIRACERARETDGRSTPESGASSGPLVASTPKTVSSPSTLAHGAAAPRKSELSTVICEASSLFDETLARDAEALAVTTDATMLAHGAMTLSRRDFFRVERAVRIGVRGVEAFECLVG
ncbi:MAG: hypothetical protein ACI81R_003698 [Bradymonadia bacterium]|jgi:hypothetical protein